ncbi:MAG: hypothetical protein IPP15_00365 [Saprospiraceae bacterium]|uniref:Uncharacterized protein n=1 Tax=Candidatus Opimibacter skivensis TaxID=2982028 RepID=A0A9D7SS57_9BACT|nr:hypothetical protein [Candidatus Opimibacter skivensis]
MNINTYKESGPGYYTINAKGNITQAGYIDFAWWPAKNWGLSLGLGRHNFKSNIEYKIPDPIHEANGEPLYENSIPYSATGLGPVISAHYRTEKLRATIGIGDFSLSRQKYTSISHIFSSTTFESSEILAHVELTEESYWNDNIVDMGLLQFAFEYAIADHFFLKLGFENSIRRFPTYPYTLKIIGFTENTPKEDQLLNDFKMQNTFSSFSVGISYIFGFGRFYVDK